MVNKDKTSRNEPQIFKCMPDTTDKSKLCWEIKHKNYNRVNLCVLPSNQNIEAHMVGQALGIIQWDNKVID